MEMKSVSAIRETNRNTIKLNRRVHRDDYTDIGRPLAKASITPETIVDIVNKLKTKSSITIFELQTLKNSLIEDPKSTEIVLNTHGALRGLIRELTGNEVKKQCAAAGCLCNLSLAESKGSVTVAKAAGPYLVTALDSLTVELAVTCAWTVGNLAGSGIKATDLLVAQGALAKLSQLLLNTNKELRDAAVYALVHCTYQLKDGLSPEFLNKILEALSKSDIDLQSIQLLFILSCHKDFHTNGLSENHLHKLVTMLPVSIQTHLNNCLQSCCKDCILLYLIRILGNVPINDIIYNYFIQSFMQNIEGFKILMLKDDVISNTVFWLLGNLYNFNCENVFFNELLR